MRIKMKLIRDDCLRRRIAVDVCVLCIIARRITGGHLPLAK